MPSSGSPSKLCRSPAPQMANCASPVPTALSGMLNEVPVNSRSAVRP